MQFTSKPHDDRCLVCCNPDPCDCDEEFNYHNYGFQDCPKGSRNGGFEICSSCGKEWRTEKAKPRLTKAEVWEAVVDSVAHAQHYLPEWKAYIFKATEENLRRKKKYHKAAAK